MRVRATINAMEKRKYYIFWERFLPLGIKREMRVCQIVICSLSGSAIIFHIISRTARFWKTS
jgi:NADH:ubiquinone oxidoreductase subunit E